ncbi:MAG: hypothetical protein IK151_06680 [Erysipelotrichaceae bacterium]|nr:hypothetical protein [Erysipelotrichaceae bacterium]
MKKILTVLLVLCSLVLVSCAKKNEGFTRSIYDPAKDIVGTWDSKDYPNMGFTYVFKEDGTGTYFGEKITWSINGDEISIGNEGVEPFVTKYEIKGNELNIVDGLGNDTIYIRK